MTLFTFFLTCDQFEHHELLHTNPIERTLSVEPTCPTTTAQRRSRNKLAPCVLHLPICPPNPLNLI